MKENKETLATRLANRSNGTSTSKYNPFKQDGINIVTGGQEVGLILAGVTRREPYGQDSPYRYVRDRGDWNNAVNDYFHNLLDFRHNIAAKFFVGSSALGFVGNAFKRRGRTVRAGLLKLC